MIPFRTQVKFFLENPAAVDMAAFTGVFQRWIQQKALGELLIDVADYRHVFQGPGVVLIGYESDYAIENRNGRLGLLYTRKRQLDPDLPAQLRTSFRLALAACQRLEADSSFRPGLKFRADEIEIRFADRLQLPNRAESFGVVEESLRGALTELYGTRTVQLAPVQGDARQLFTVAVHAEGVSSLADLRQLQPSVET